MYCAARELPVSGEAPLPSATNSDFELGSRSMLRPSSVARPPWPPISEPPGAALGASIVKVTPSTTCTGITIEAGL
jgi:hypothetical protein